MSWLVLNLESLDWSWVLKVLFDLESWPSLGSLADGDRIRDTWKSLWIFAACLATSETMGSHRSINLHRERTEESARNAISLETGYSLCCNYIFHILREHAYHLVKKRNKPPLHAFRLSTREKLLFRLGKQPIIVSRYFSGSSSSERKLNYRQSDH